MAGSGNAHLRHDSTDLLLSVENLTVHFPASGGKTVHAVSNLSLDLLKGETLGLVGESGCGKSTTAKAIIQLPKPTSGSVIYRNRDLVDLQGEALRRVRPDIQMIFQDPISSLNPRRRVYDIVGEGLGVWNKQSGSISSGEDRVVEMMTAVGLDPMVAKRKRPHEYSGGQCQRISVARALVLEPQVLICDEPVSALDVSVQAQILNILEDMKARYGLTLLFISHDLAVVKNISDRVAVMYLGKLCEIGDGDQIYTRPAHPYTQLLLSAVPDPQNAREPQIDRMDGELPSPTELPSGCRFRTRCPHAQTVCSEVEPEFTRVGSNTDHWVACHFPL